MLAFAKPGNDVVHMGRTLKIENRRTGGVNQLLNQQRLHLANDRTFRLKTDITFKIVATPL